MDINEKMPSNIRGKDEPLFEIGISNTAFLGNIFFIWKFISSNFSLTVDKNGLTSEAVNQSNTIHISIELFRENFHCFSFKENADLDSNKIKATFKTEELISAVPSSGKFTGFLTMFEGDYQKLRYYKAKGSSPSTIETMTTITPFISSRKEFSVDPIPDEPITIILTSEFVDAINSIAKERIPKVRFEMYKRGFRMYGTHSSGGQKGLRPFGDTSDPYTDNQRVDHRNEELIERIRQRVKLHEDDKKKIESKKFIVKTTQNYKQNHTISVPIECVKPLVRLRTASPEGSLVKVYYLPSRTDENGESTSPVIILRCMAGIYGNLVLRLRNSDWNLERSS